jgi:hypothetical protein
MNSNQYIPNLSFVPGNRDLVCTYVVCHSFPPFGVAPIAPPCLSTPDQIFPHYFNPSQPPITPHSNILLSHRSYFLYNVHHYTEVTYHYKEYRTMAPPQKRSKRKRTNNRDEPNDPMAVETVMNSPSPSVGEELNNRMAVETIMNSPALSTGDEMIPTSASKSRHDSLENDREIKDALHPYVNGPTDIDLWNFLMKTMRTALETQNRACEKLLKLTGKLHIDKWAQHLDEEERWLYKTECQHVKMDQTVVQKHLDVAARYMKRLEKAPQSHEGKRASSVAAQVQPAKLLVGLLESNMEVLISELQIEKQAREHAEEKLRAKEQGE